MILLCELLKDWPCTATGGNLRAAVRGVTDHSAEVVPGTVFVARKGRKSNGLDHITEAIRNGASAIVTDVSSPPDLPKEIVAISVPDAVDFLAHACSAFYGHPSKELKIIAVTGTNGKTTTTHFIGQLLKASGIRTAVIGTLGVWVDGGKSELEVPPMTTLPPSHLHRVLRHCLDEGVTHIAMEASSLGLSGGRLDHCRIDYGVFLNIGKDHHAEHGGEEAYIRAKGRLAGLAEQVILNGEDALVSRSAGNRKPVMTFGECLADGEHLRITETDDGNWEASCNDIKMEFGAPVAGRHNRMNAAAAFAVLTLLGFRLHDLCGISGVLSLPEGRMQESERGGVRVFVDYAHTPDALTAVLEALSLVCKGRLITVFGCGGDRDREKRPEMGEIAAVYSTSVWVTSDNPRSEDPLSIISDILEGMGGESNRYRAEPDREQAIRNAINEAEAGDIVLVAGKGHEAIQVSSGAVRAFSDLLIAERILMEVHGCKKEEVGADSVQTTDRIWYDGGGTE